LDLLEAQGMMVSFDASSLPVHLELAPGRRRDLFLLLKEAIHNVARHSGAKRVEIRFGATASEIAVEIADDGVGFSPQAVGHDSSGNGLLTMRRRAEAQGGDFDLESSPGAGTRVRLRLPL
ncbi:MAG: hypothetical protein K8H90_00165, partial [Thermoanaerobaculia bacterium]|nr:hypothetical protein [Thermoanaerobaculia bacterium]